MWWIADTTLLKRLLKAAVEVKEDESVVLIEVRGEAACVGGGGGRGRGGGGGVDGEGVRERVGF